MIIFIYKFQISMWEFYYFIQRGFNLRWLKYGLISGFDFLAVYGLLISNLILFYSNSLWVYVLLIKFSYN